MDYAFLLVARPDIEEGPRRPLLVGREVLTAHVGRHDLQSVLAEDVLHGLLYLPGYLFVVDHGPVARLVSELVAGSVGLRDALDHALHQRGHHLPDIGIEGADRANHLDHAGDDVVRGASGELAHRDDHVVYGVCRARYDVLQISHDLRAHGDAVDHLVRHRRVAALALDRDLEYVRRGHHGAVGNPDLAYRELRPQVRAYDGVHPVHHPGLDELLPAAGGELLGVLEHEAHLAPDTVLHLREDLRGPQQHGRVAVVPAGVHRARVLRGELEVVLLLYGQRVHVGPAGRHGRVAHTGGERLRVLLAEPWRDARLRARRPHGHAAGDREDPLGDEGPYPGRGALRVPARRGTLPRRRGGARRGRGDGRGGCCHRRAPVGEAPRRQDRGYLRPHDGRAGHIRGHDQGQGRPRGDAAPGGRQHRRGRAGRD